MARINLRSRYIYIPTALMIVALIVTGGWWLSIERLPGYNTDPIQRSSYIEPSGVVSEYFTGTVVSLEISIIGPKLTVNQDTTGSDRTFYLPSEATVWIGMTLNEKSITGQEKVTYDEIKKGQRVAVFIGPSNKARRVNILKR